MGKVRHFSAQGASPGIAIGKVVLLDRPRDAAMAPADGDGDRGIPLPPGQEWEAFLEARRVASMRIAEMKDVVLALADDSQSLSLIQGLEALVTDKTLAQLIHEAIHTQGRTAVRATQDAFTHLRGLFERLRNEHLREKLCDLEACQNLLVEALTGTAQDADDARLEGSIVFARHFTPRDILKFVQCGVAGVVAEHGTLQSHVAILARNFSIPAVLGAKGCVSAVEKNEIVVVDGSNGRVDIAPPAQAMRKHEARRAFWKMLGKELMSRAALPCVTRDGRAVEVHANVDSHLEIPPVQAAHASGVGLFRMESFFLGRKDMPTEDEIHQELRMLVDALPFKDITVRLLDAGGDKQIPQLNQRGEGRKGGESSGERGRRGGGGDGPEPGIDAGPFHDSIMGLRGVRILALRPDLLRAQVRACLRANADANGNVRILIPFVTTLEEIRLVKDAIAREWRDLSVASPRPLPVPRVGIMIEVPAAVAMADLFAREVDFFSIGTNDLASFTLAVDREVGPVGHLYDAFHPAVLRLIRQTLQAAQQANKPVSLCGELAADRLATELLIGLGLRQFSCSAAAIPCVKDVARRLSTRDAEALARDVMTLGSAAEVRMRLQMRFLEVFGDDAATDGARLRAV